MICNELVFVRNHFLDNVTMNLLQLFFFVFAWILSEILIKNIKRGCFQIYIHFLIVYLSTDFRRGFLTGEVLDVFSINSGLFVVHCRFVFQIYHNRLWITFFFGRDIRDQKLFVKSISKFNFVKTDLLRLLFTFNHVIFVN